jgi:lysylphosphatidylglycerol synthetase-like protein (DUF2156 family)
MLAPRQLPPSALTPAEVVDHPSGYLALRAGNERFTAPGLAGFCAYRAQGRSLFLFGGVHAPEPDRAALLDAFLEESQRQGRGVAAVQVREAQAELFRSRGFVVNRFGASYALSLCGFSLAGGARMKLRNKLKRAGRLGLAVMELGRELPRDAGSWARLAEVSRAWLGAKGKPEIDFMVGELGSPAQSERRVFAAVDGQGQVEGFITYVPAWGARSGYLHDLTRRLPEAAPGTMELINAFALERFRQEGVAHLHFGFTPFLVEGQDGPGSSPLVSKVVRWLGRYGAFVYPARSQVDYKLKWGPELIEPEYVAFRPLSLRAVFDLLRVTRSL